jgi:catechol 2,3-dioxygenase-like lactoylglutathione lyase family enzyme
VIGRPHHVVIDAPEPEALAEFYAALFSMPVTYRSPDFVVVAQNGTSSGYAFQRAPDYVPPRWPDPAGSQQMHIDVMVEDEDEAGAAVVALGARLLDAAGHVYADPAGHPFCLIRRPTWAPQVPPG